MLKSFFFYLALQGWDEWSVWSRCDENNEQHRRRKCLTTNPGPELCQGRSIQVRMCVAGDNNELDNGKLSGIIFFPYSLKIYIKNLYFFFFRNSFPWCCEQFRRKRLCKRSCSPWLFLSSIPGWSSSRHYVNALLSKTEKSQNSRESSLHFIKTKSLRNGSFKRTPEKNPFVR